MRELLRERDRLCRDHWETKYSLPEWTIAPLLAAGLTRAELATVSTGTEAGEKARLDKLEQLIAEVDRELLAIVIQVRTGQAGERASLASVIKLAIQELQSERRDHDHGRADLVARLLQLASSCLEPDRPRESASPIMKPSIPA